ncbi:hypothetical protein Trydic_g14288 [Trypoxylus dichotomus]
MYVQPRKPSKTPDPPSTILSIAASPVCRELLSHRALATQHAGCSSSYIYILRGGGGGLSRLDLLHCGPSARARKLALAFLPRFVLPLVPLQLHVLRDDADVASFARPRV